MQPAIFLHAKLPLFVYYVAHQIRRAIEVRAGCDADMDYGVACEKRSELKQSL